MDAALLLSAIGLGAAGAPHCAAMCAAPCAAAVRQGRGAEQAAFHLSRLAAYSAAGALAAGSVNALAALGSLSPVFKPLWTLVHAAALALGIWLALTGRQPAWVERIGARTALQTARAGTGTWMALRGPVRSAAIGSLWVAWPCGLLQSAILVAALANTPLTGAAVMAAFAVVSATSLVAAPWVFRRLGGSGAGAWWQTAGVRLAGSLLALASGWALTAGIWAKVAAYCGW